MINKDYILRIAERLGRELSILLGLRQRNKHEESLIYIDELLLNTVGLTSRFINSLSEETLLQALSPLGSINVEHALWIAALLKIEGEIYAEQHLEGEAYYRYVKSLYLYLATLQQEPGILETEIAEQINDLLQKLDQYQLPFSTQRRLFPYYELVGQYAKAEDVLFSLVEVIPADAALYKEGLTFYQRLRRKSAEELAAGNFSSEEIEEGVSSLQHLFH